MMRFVRGREGGAREVRVRENEPPEDPRVIEEVKEKGRRARESAGEVRGGV